METSFKPNHIGRKISRLRELRGLKQESIAWELGITQQAVSKLEQSETIEDEVLQKVAKALGLSVEAIKNFDEEKIMYFVQNNYEGANSGNGNISQHSNYHNCTFNPLDKLLEVIDENKKLYERLLQSEREKIEILKSNQR